MASEVRSHAGASATATGHKCGLLVDVIRDHARIRGDDVALVFTSGGPERTMMTYQALDDGACACAEKLMHACPDGGHVLLPMRSDPRSVVALVGCLYAGLACAPIPFPNGDAGMRRIRALTTAPNCAALAAAPDDVAKLAAAISVTVVAIDDRPAPHRDFTPQARECDLALIQYTSGSGSDPKGVLLTHANLAANLDMLRNAFAVGPEDSFASWLPLFHDMGLVVLLMLPLYTGRLGILMPPISFIRDPARWLSIIAADRVTITGAPNFAYELCARRVTAEVAARLDLSHLRLAFNGAEPVRRSTLRLFCERFSSADYKPSAFFPCYGLAEAVTFVSGGHLTAEAVLEADTAHRPEKMVCCGRPARSSVVVIVDAGLQPLADGAVGEICVAGPHIGLGYHDRSEASSATFGVLLDGYPGLRFLRTGDLGFVQGGQLTISGRIRDVITHRGVNLHAVDVEHVITSSHPAFGEAAAFPSERNGTEDVVVVQELARSAAVDDPNGLLRTAEEAIVEHLGIRPFDVVLVRAGTIPRTTSGKVRRGACRRLYEAGSLGNIYSLRLEYPKLR